MKPNSDLLPDFFDDSFVFKQLETSGTIAYHELMKCGYPIKRSISELFQKLTPYLQPRQISIGPSCCCLIFLLSNGFSFRDFKLSKTELNFRPAKCYLLDAMESEFWNPTNNVANKFKQKFHTFIRRTISIKIRFVGAREYLFSGSFIRDEYQ